MSVPLGGKKAAGRVALVDDADYDLVTAYSWRVWERPATERRRGEGPYAIANLPRTDTGRPVVTMHKLLTGNALTDHIDHDGLNNQRRNLRPATVAQNGRNRRAQLACSSAWKGVTWSALKRKWQAAIMVDGRRTPLGMFVSEEDAARAYDTAARAAFGEYAELNFP